MRKVIVQEFTTIDGFAAGPNGEIDFINDASEADPTTGEFVDDQLAFLGTVDTILLGAVTYRRSPRSGPSRRSRPRASPMP
jgi:hypothetical protein